MAIPACVLFGELGFGQSVGNKKRNLVYLEELEIAA